MVSKFTSIALLLAMIVACQAPTTEVSTEVSEPKLDRASLRAIFQSLEDTLAMAYNNKNVDLFKRFYAEDAVTYGEGREQLFGRREMTDHFVNTIVNDSTDVNFQYMTIDIFHEGNLAVETGKWVEMDSEGNEEDHGFYVVVFQKERGKWIAVRDIWNSSTTGTEYEGSTDQANAAGI